MSNHNPIQNHFHLSRMNEMTAMYWTQSLRATANSFIIILIPIFLIRVGFSIQQILIIFVAEGIAWLILLYPCTYVLSKYGTNFVMSAATISSIGFMLSLAFLPSNSVLVVSYVIFIALANLYWFSFRLNFTAVTEGKEAGKKIGFINALSLAGQGAAPAIGGIIATLFGIHWTYTIAIVIVLFAAAPLFRAPDIVKWSKLDMKKVNIKKMAPDLVANFGQTIDDCVGALVWPLLIFSLIPTYAGVGILSTFMVVSAIFISLWVGYKESKKGEAHYIKRGSMLIALTNLLRFLAQSIFQIAGANFMAGIGQALYTTPFASRYYKNASRESTFEYIFAMQVISALAWIAYPLLLLIASFFLSDKQVLLFGALLAIPATWAIRFMRTQ